MSETASALEGIIGQDHAARVLTAAIKSGHPHHAYLFAGPPGVGKMAAAARFAAALCCERDGCGECLGCVKALKGTHPDIMTVKPVGSLITVDQIREVNRSLNLHPHESRARVFIIAEAEALGSEGANAFLKSLEEPPPFVFFLLLAAAADRVLPTIASRCQIVRFGYVPAPQIEAYVQSQHDVSATVAQACARVSGGNLALAAALGADGELADRRQRYLRIGADLCRGGWEGGARELAAQVMDAARDAGEAAGQEDTSVPEGFDSAGGKRRQQDAHRRASAARKQELALALGFLQTWFRDMMVTAAGAGESVLNRDYELELEDQALPSRVDDYRRALEVIEAARSKLGYNIDLELAVEAMFLELQEVL